MRLLGDRVREAARKATNLKVAQELGTGSSVAIKLIAGNFPNSDNYNISNYADISRIYRIDIKLKVRKEDDIEKESEKGLELLHDIINAISDYGRNSQRGEAVTRGEFQVVRSSNSVEVSQIIII